MRLLALLAFAAAAFAQTNNTIITLIPITNPSTGAPADPGSLVFRDLGTHHADISAPDTLVSTYRLRLPADNLSGCLKNTASGSDGQLSAVACGGVPVPDTTVITQDGGDATKQFRVENSGIPTGTTVVGTVPNASFTFAGINLSQTFGGANTFSATQTMHDIDFSADDTYKIGLTNRAYNIAVNRVEGMCSLCDANANYVNTRKLNLYDSLGTSDLGLSISATAGLPGNRWISFNDNAGMEMVRFEKDFLGTTTNLAKFTLSIVPDGGSGTQQIGTVSAPWWSGVFVNLAATGTFQDGALAGTGNRLICASPTGVLQATSCPSASLPVPDTTIITQNASDTTKQFRLSNAAISTGATRVGTIPNANFTFAGSDISQTFTQNQTFAANILASGSRDIGSTGTPFANAYITNAYSVNNRVCDAGATPCFITQKISGLNVLGILDPSSSVRMQIDATTSPGKFSIQGHVLPLTRNTTDVGQAFPNEFRNAYFAGTVNADSGFKLTTSTVLSKVSGFNQLDVDIAHSSEFGNPNTGNLLITQLGTTVAFWDTSGNFSPGTNNTRTNGTSSRRWSNGYFVNLDVSGTATIGGLAGTFNMSGNQTVTGNFYNRSFAGSGISCSGVGDGWTGWDTSGQNLIICASGSRYRVQLMAY